MLVLTRNLGQKVVIGDNITLTIVECRGDTVRIGISAPQEVPIARAEIYRGPARVPTAAEVAEVSRREDVG